MDQSEDAENKDQLLNKYFCLLTEQGIENSSPHQKDTCRDTGCVEYYFQRVHIGGDVDKFRRGGINDRGRDHNARENCHQKRPEEVSLIAVGMYSFRFSPDFFGSFRFFFLLAASLHDNIFSKGKQVIAGPVQNQTRRRRIQENQEDYSHSVQLYLFLELESL